MKEKLGNLVFDLDHDLNALESNISTLEDVKVLLGHLVEDMEKAVLIGEERAYYGEHQRMVRVLWHLVRHTVDELGEDFYKAVRVKDDMREAIRRENEKNHSAGNTMVSVG